MSNGVYDDLEETGPLELLETRFYCSAPCFAVSLFALDLLLHINMVPAFKIFLQSMTFNSQCLVIL